VEPRDALIGFSDWQGYGHAERAAAWLARIEMNRPEIDAFRAAPTPDAAPYVAVAAPLAAADGISSGEARLAANAQQALARARGMAELNAFTFLPERLDPHGPGFLAGVPVVVKDLMQVAGMPLSGGGKAMGRPVATHDAEVVARLRRAGAVVIGLANLHEFAYGITSDNAHFGRVVNPAAPAHIPGGSSGGSAAAVAAGIARLAIGTDTAGSIRVPAACCGIVGFKPGYDVLPRTGVIDLAASLDHMGPMALTVEDCAAMFAAMLGLDAIPRWVRGDLSGVRAMRLGGYFAEPLDDEVRACLDEAMLALAGDGARCGEGSIEGAELAPAITLNTISPEATAFHARRLKERPGDFGEEVRVRLEMGLFFPGHWYVKAQRMRAALVARIEAAFGEADVLVCPTMRAPAPPVGATRGDIGGKPFALHTRVTNLTQPFNLSGLPAIAIPWAKSTGGVPISIQLAGPRGHDWKVLSIAQRLQAASPWRASVGSD
jgi:aspartyl-tRNA(Asn)/glutamyl-tRNA(Gln) amidotransferase subunit A